MIRTCPRFASLATCTLGLFTLWALAGCASDSSATSHHGPIRQLSFDTPEDAAAALAYAASIEDRAYSLSLFGPELGELSSGDASVDAYERKLFAAAIQRKRELQTNTDGSVDILIGEKAVAFPIPIVEVSGRWMFDTPEGVDRLTDIRVGYNELKTIAALRGIYTAQDQFRNNDADGDGKRLYASQILSSPGKKDGLYWPTGPNEPNSPLGAFYTEGEVPSSERLGYHGYFYRMLSTAAQTAGSGPNDIGAPVNPGYLVIAYPAVYDQTGIMTLYMSDDGRIYQKDLGPAATRTAGTMSVMSINLGDGWSITHD